MPQHDRISAAHPCKASDLLADPSNTIRNGIHTFDNRQQKAVGDLHQHRQSWGDNGLNVGVGRCDLRWYTPGQVWRQCASFLLNLCDHLLIDLKSG